MTQVAWTAIAVLPWRWAIALRVRRKGSASSQSVWMMAWPAISCALVRNDLEGALELAALMTRPDQQVLQDDLDARLGEAVALHRHGDTAGAAEALAQLEVRARRVRLRLTGDLRVYWRREAIRSAILRSCSMVTSRLPSSPTLVVVRRTPRVPFRKAKRVRLISSFGSHECRVSEFAHRGSYRCPTLGPLRELREVRKLDEHKCFVVRSDDLEVPDTRGRFRRTRRSPGASSGNREHDVVAPQDALDVSDTDELADCRPRRFDVLVHCRQRSQLCGGGGFRRGADLSCCRRWLARRTAT